MTDWPAPRLAPPAPETFSPRQREIHDAILTGPRGAVQGPLAVWLHRPELADRAQALGQYCRYETALTPRLSELAILTVARHWQAEFEWYAHEAHARAAGLEPAIIEAVRQGRQPDFPDDEARVVHTVARTVLADRTLPDALYAEGETVLGRDRLVDLVGLLGYYCLISLTLNVFRVMPPEDATRAFD